jgi:hypothetical protein
VNKKNYWESVESSREAPSSPAFMANDNNNKKDGFIKLKLLYNLPLR